MALVTLEDIARMANVSKSTVSRILNGKKEGYSKETEQHVRKILNEVSYDGQFSRFPYSSRTKTIGLIIPDTTNSFFQQMINTVESFVSKNGYTLLLGISQNSTEQEKRYVDAFVIKRVDGLILIPTSPDTLANYKILEKYEVPCVLLDRRLQDAGPFRAGVFCDSAYQVFLACEKLIRHNDRRIVFLSGPREISTSKERYEGYCSALVQYGMTADPELVEYGDFSISSGFHQIGRLIEENIPFDAIFASNDMMAIGAMTALEQAGMRVPQDVEIIGFDGIEMGGYTSPQLSTIIQPIQNMAFRAVEMLFALMNEVELETPFIQCEATVLMRGTTRAK